MTARDTRIDFLRGFALLSILINHAQQISGIYYFVPTIKHVHPGFSDSAEIFVFLSGLSVSLAYGPAMLHRPLAGFRRIGMRILRIYALQLLVISAVFLLYAALSFSPHIAAGPEIMAIAHRPLESLLDALMLTLQPSYINILPLYIVLMVFTPLMLTGFQRAPGLTWVVCLVVYMVSLALLYMGWSDFIPHPEKRWSFFPGSWQLIYCGGLWAGMHWDRWKDMLPSSAMVGFAWLILVSVSAIRIIGRLGENMSALSWLPLNKQFLEPLLVLHFLSLYVLWHRYVPGDAPWLGRWPATWLRMVGRHSLELFSVGTVLSFAIALLALKYESRLLHIGLSLAAVLISVLVAHLLEIDKPARSDPRASEGSPG
ncbi:MAG: OpgC domain-containing protein [Leptospiraceae bacterium]|nr:OpgC domain-containing protein [Leptospiraceae bacterium]